MTRRVAVMIVMALALGAVGMASAFAARGGKGPPVVESKTCQERIDNGAVWSLGTYENGVYTVETTPGCLDFDFETEPYYFDTACVAWEVTGVQRFKGLKFVFENGLHGTEYAVLETGDTSGRWLADLSDTGWETAPMPAFVAMSRNGDRWENITLTVTPGTCTA